MLALYEGLNEPGVPVVGGDTTRAGARASQRHRARPLEARAGPRGSAPGDALVVTGPLGAAGAAFREGRLRTAAARLEEGRELAAHAHAMLDVSDGLAVDAGHLARRSGVRCVIELERVPLAAGATVEDLGFGEDYELLAAVEDPLASRSIGRCEEGEGVEIRLEGSPVPLTGWDHFGGQAATCADPPQQQGYAASAGLHRRAAVLGGVLVFVITWITFAIFFDPPPKQAGSEPQGLVTPNLQQQFDLEGSRPRASTWSSSSVSCSTRDFGESLRQPRRGAGESSTRSR